MSQSWKANRLKYILEYYGTWDNVIKHSKVNKLTRVSTITLPQSVIDRINHDPNCYPPRSPSWFGRFTPFNKFKI